MVLCRQMVCTENKGINKFRQICHSKLNYTSEWIKNANRNVIDELRRHDWSEEVSIVPAKIERKKIDAAIHFWVIFFSCASRFPRIFSLSISRDTNTHTHVRTHNDSHLVCIRAQRWYTSNMRFDVMFFLFAVDARRTPKKAIGKKFVQNCFLSLLLSLRSRLVEKILYHCCFRCVEVSVCTCMCVWVCEWKVHNKTPKLYFS